LLTDNCYYLVAEYGHGVPVANYRFDTVADFDAFVFELTYALKEAFEKHKFHHDDLHAKNVLFITGPFAPRRYGDLLIENPGRPMIIDYGLSTFDTLASAKEHVGVDPGDDEALKEYLEYLYPVKYYPFKKRHGVLRDIYKIFSWLSALPQLPSIKDRAVQMYTASQGMDSFEALLAFIYPQKTLMGHQITSPPCHVCGNAATQVYEHAPSWKFCNRSQCARSMGPIGFLLAE
jgi:hypothetical protein